MWTFGNISLVVMLGVAAAGGAGFLAGWLMRKAIVEEREAAAEAQDNIRGR